MFPVDTFCWLVATFLLVVLYYLLVHNFTYFSRRGVRFVRGIPLLGTNWKVALGREPLVDGLQRLYNSFPAERLVGVYEIGNQPQFLLCDPQLVKEVTIRGADNFLDHRMLVQESADPLAARNVFFLKGQSWRNMRTTLSPAFTGSKIRVMLPLMLKCSEDFLCYLEANLQGSSGADEDLGFPPSAFECEMKDMFVRYSNDAIASCAFGLDMDSFVDRNNEFFQMGKSLTEPSTEFLLRNLGYSVMPRVMNALRVRIFKHADSEFFCGILRKTIAHRRSSGEVRNDLLDNLLQAQKAVASQGSRLTEFDDIDLAAQCIIFYFAGFDTVSTSLAFLSYELAANPDIQQRLYAEIKGVHESLNGSAINYEQLNTLKYLDMVISEALRKWPPSVLYDRICNTATTLDLGGGRQLEVRPGDGFMIPAYAIQHDPLFWPQPDHFDPERFSATNVGKIKAGTYLPFGIGPRICVGQRLALMEMKVVVFRMLLQWQLKLSAKMQTPLRLGKGLFLEAEGGIWVEFMKRRI